MLQNFMFFIKNTMIMHSMRQLISVKSACRLPQNVSPREAYGGGGRRLRYL